MTQRAARPALTTVAIPGAATSIRRLGLTAARPMLALVAMLAIAGLVRAQENPTGTIIVGSEEDYPPFATGNTDEKAGGFTVDLWKAVAAEAGLTYTIRVRPFRLILDEFRAGKIDVLINLAQSEERRAFADFAVTHFIVHGAIFVRADESGIESEADFAGKSILVLNADLGHDYALSKGWGPHLVPVDNAAEGMELLASGQHDAMLLSKIAGLQILQKLNIRDVRALATKAGFSQKFSFAVRKGNSELLARVNEGLAIAKSNGVYDDLYEQWFGLFETRELTLGQLMKYLGPILLVVLIAVGLFMVRQHERAKGEQRLRDSEQRLRLALSAAQQGLYDLDVQTGECIVSPEYALMFGYDPAGFHETNAAWRERLHPDDREAAGAAYSDYVAGRRGEYRVEFRQRTREGGWKWILSLGRIVSRSADGKPLRMLGTHTDITERKVAAEKLREREERLRVALSASGTGTFRWDIRTNEMSWDDALNVLFGLPEGQTVRSLEDFVAAVHPEDRSGVIERCERCAREGADFEMELRVVWPDGMVHWLDDRGKTFLDDAGKPLYMTGACVDITARKRAAEELAASAEFNESLIGSMQDGFSVMDANGIQSDVNPAFCRMTGFSRGELIGAEAPYPYWPPEEREAIQAALTETMKGHVADLEVTFMHKSGERFPVIVSPASVKNQAGEAISYSATVKDITELRQAAIEREQLARKMQETQRLEGLGVLAGGIAHDFNNLLTSIIGNVSVAMLEVAPGSPVHESIEHINEAALRAADLCKQMLAYSGRGRFVVQKLDLGQLIEQTAQMLQISISKKAVLRFNLEKGLPPVEVDATQIRQVMMNLVINASEAIGDTSGVISLSTGLARVDRRYLEGTLMETDVKEGDYVFLEVSDSGCGMSAETQARMFDPFFTMKFTGRGLGLAAVLGIVRGHKGALKVYSEPGRGTIFRLLFPAAAGASESAVARPVGGLDWRGHGTVLVVDDEETMRSTVGRMMRVIGLDPVLVADGQEAVEVFRARPERFALVLLDLTMPHMDGVQTFSELRRMRPDVRVVLMSGFNAQEALVRFQGKGLASFLQKPFTINSLSATLRDVMGAEGTA